MDENIITHLDKIISNRLTSGVVIIDTSGDILYVNEEAQSILSTFSSGDSESSPGSRTLNRAVVNMVTENLDSVSEPMSKCVYCPDSNSTYALRTLPLHTPDEAGKTCILILIEGVTLHRKFDMKVVQKQFGLTSREAEVTFCLTKGLTNKEIAKALSLSHETVHDYVKQVMKKTGARTRAGIVGKVLP